jgi:subtilisin family serine protease
MKKYFLITPIVLAVLLFANPTIEFISIDKEVKSDMKILLKFKDGDIDEFKYINTLRDVKNDKLTKLFKGFGIESFKAVFKNRYNEDGILKKDILSKNNRLNLENWRQLEVATETLATKLIEKLNKNQLVEKAIIERPMIFNPHIAPNDTDYEDQWHLNNTDNTDINAEDAWDINTGRNDVIIAVCDGGIDYNHLDLDPGDRSRIIGGTDTGSNDNDPIDDLPFNDPDSYAGHGTRIAGVIGAITDNDSDVSGVMWNCQIMPIKMVGSGSLTVTYPFGAYNWNFSTTAFPSDVADGIDFATNNGADIINLSYGFPDMGYPINEVILRIPLLFDAISNAYNNDVVIVASMGNEGNGSNPTNYPAAFRHEVIAVGATDPDGNRRFSSSTGPHINVSAPGTGIVTTNRGGGTTSVSGTSFSAPIVAGVAGLIISQSRDRGFTITNDDVRHILELTADDVTGPGIGFDEETGFGRVNAFNALQLLDIPNTVQHGISYGGTSTKINTLSPWVYIGSRWGLAAGTYFQVDQYEVTKRISFETPFCDPPEVWIREKESVSMHFGNPNNGYPYAEITNVDAQGFNVKYAAYFVKYNALAQSINKWIPSHPNNTAIAYTAVGHGNLSNETGEISGPYLVCTSNKSYTLNDIPPNSTVSWTYSSNLTYVSGQGTSTLTVKGKSSYNSSGWVKATITTQNSCSNATRTKNIWVGKFNSTVVTGTAAVCPDTYYTYTAQVPGGHSSSYSYTWSYPSNWMWPYYSQNTFRIKTPMYNPEYGTVRVSITNTCGTSSYSGITVYPSYSCGYYYSYYPNPVSEELTIEAVDATTDKTLTTNTVDFSVDLYDSDKKLVKQAKNKENKITINVESLKKGTYFLHIKDKNEVLKKQIIIE